MWAIYEYIDQRDQGVIAEWDLEIEPRAKLDQKIDMLATAGPGLPPALLASLPGRLLKLKVKGRVQLRPILCAGPIKNDQEFTFLARAVERDGELEPANVLEVAAKRRQEIIEDLGRRRLLCSEV